MATGSLDERATESEMTTRIGIAARIRMSIEGWMTGDTGRRIRINRLSKHQVTNRQSADRS
jgi:hypothetical protein